MLRVIPFVSRGELTARKQVDAFIEHARSNYMGIIGLQSEDFDKPIWTFDMRLLGSKRRKDAHIKFTMREESVKRGVGLPMNGQMIKGTFLEFSKALFLQRLINGRFQAASDLMIVIKEIEFVVRSRLGDEAHPSLIVKADVIKVDSLITELAQKSAYRRGVILGSLVRIMDELRLLARPLAWKNPHPKPRELRLDISPEAEKRRQEKMPSQRAVLALIQLGMWALEGKMYKKIPAATVGTDGGSTTARRHSDEVDGIVALGLALNAIGLNCRISELALMPSDPESFTLSKGEKDSDGIAEDEDRFALRWKPIKGGAPMVKPFSRQFAPFAKMIIEKLKKLSHEPRGVARHYEKNPCKLYLPPALKHLRNNEWLSAEDVVKILGIEMDSLSAWVDRNHVIKKCIEKGEAGTGTHLYKFISLEKVLLKRLPKGFPYVVGKLKYSESMFCCFYKQTHATRGTCKVIPSHFGHNPFEHALSARVTVKGHQTIFERYGFYEEDGSKFDLGTHEFRHFWQTQLKKAGVSELIAAYAAGRADIGQNEAYDLRSPSEAADLSFDIVNRSRQRIFEQSALAVAHEVLESAVRQTSSGKTVIVSFSKDAIVTFDNETGALNVQGCHLNQYGICGHNYISSGCGKYSECLDCDALLCVKGIKALEKNAKDKAGKLRELLVEYQKQLQEDVSDGIEGSDQWLEKTTRQIAKLDALINDVYLNKNVPDGTAVKLSANQKRSSELARELVSKLGHAMNNERGSEIGKDKAEKDE